MSDRHEPPVHTGYLTKSGPLHAMEESRELVHLDGDPSKRVVAAITWVRPCCARVWVTEQSCEIMDYRYRGNGHRCRHQACVRGFAYLDANP